MCKRISRWYLPRDDEAGEQEEGGEMGKDMVKMYE